MIRTEWPRSDTGSTTQRRERSAHSGESAAFRLLGRCIRTGASSSRSPAEASWAQSRSNRPSIASRLLAQARYLVDFSRFLFDTYGLPWTRQCQTQSSPRPDETWLSSRQTESYQITRNEHRHLAPLRGFSPETRLADQFQCECSGMAASIEYGPRKNSISISALAREHVRVPLGFSRNLHRIRRQGPASRRKSWVEDGSFGKGRRQGADVENI